MMTSILVRVPESLVPDPSGSISPLSLVAVPLWDLRLRRLLTAGPPLLFSSLFLVADAFVIDHPIH